MSSYENAKAVAAFMNANPDASLDTWNQFAFSHGMVSFDYGDDDWYRNDDYVVTRLCDRYDISCIDRYDI